ncbi:MAG: peptidoglycan editing factor PgeF [Hyphomicrobiaceae bacterium]
MPNPVLSDTLSDVTSIRHGFFTREGGVSTGLYAGLNVGLGSGDDREAVLENRRRVACHLGFNSAPINTLHQVHSADVVILDANLSDTPPRADALVTQMPGVIIGALAADCTPVLFADATTGVIGAGHAGWRGAKAGILEATIEAMVKLGAAPGRIRAVVGPTIGQANYEVGQDFRDAFVSDDPATDRFFIEPPGQRKPHFDLPGFVSFRLQRLGLLTIEARTTCTYADPDRFYSYRRATHRGEPDYGRQISAIVVA